MISHRAGICEQPKWDGSGLEVSEVAGKMSGGIEHHKALQGFEGAALKGAHPDGW